MFAEKINKILDSFANIPRQKQMNMTDEEKRKHEAKTFCYLRCEKINKKAGNLETIVTTQGNIGGLPIPYVI